MREARWHVFQGLTKRFERLAALSAELKWPDNVRMGVSIEGDKYCFVLIIFAGSESALRGRTYDEMPRSAVATRKQSRETLRVLG